MEIQQNYPLSNLTTFRIGGPASDYVKVTNLDELKHALTYAHEKSLAVLVIGGGSNLLIKDQGFKGLVIHNQIPGLNFEDSGLVSVGAGENWDKVVAKTVAKGLAGIECLSGVPGSSGGAVVQNIGAYGQTISDSIVRVDAIEAATAKAQLFSVAECEFGYRTSWFKKNLGQYIVTNFQLRLQPQGQPTITYPHVKKHFEKQPTPSLSEVRQFIIRLRASKGYLIMPGYESFATAGSFFKNPIVSFQEFERLKPILGDSAQNRFWPASTSHDFVGRGGETPTGYKLAAAFLMEEAGFKKGYREGHVGISPKHSLSLVNFGGATTSEIKTFADRIKNVVLAKFGVKLEEEVLYV